MFLRERLKSGERDYHRLPNNTRERPSTGFRTLSYRFSFPPNRQGASYRSLSAGPKGRLYDRDRSLEDRLKREARRIAANIAKVPERWCASLEVRPARRRAAKANVAAVRKYNTGRARLVGVGFCKPGRVLLPRSVRARASRGRRRRLLSGLAKCARRERQCKD